MAATSLGLGLGLTHGHARSVAGPATGWTPANLADFSTAVVGWYDFSDQNASHVTLSGSNITTAIDLGPGGNDMTQGGAVSTPTSGTVADWGGKYGAQYDGTARGLTTADLTTVAQPLSIIIFYRTNSAIANLTECWELGDSNHPEVSLRWSEVSDHPHAWAGTNGVARWGAPLATNTSYIDITLFNGASTVCAFNGTLGSTVSATPGGTGLTAIKLGDFFFGSIRAQPDFTVGEMLVLNRLPTTDERQNIEGYLAWKFGRQDDLPVDHPRKSAAP